MADISLECPKCNGRTLATREPEDPARAVRVQIMCPACNPGDFDSPIYFDSEGNEVAWHEGVAPDDSPPARRCPSCGAGDGQDCPEDCACQPMTAEESESFERSSDRRTP